MTTQNRWIPEAARGGVVAIGNFDGMHPGHRALIATAARIAREKGLPLTALTFEPHPREFSREAEPFRLTLQTPKERLLKEAGADHVVTLPFDAGLAALTAEVFIADILVEGLAARHVVVGEDFHFGRQRGGTVATLESAGGFGVTALAPACDAEGTPYSSTRVRDALRTGDFARAEALLGYPFEVEGEVLHGDKRGREIGFPTANQDVTRYVRIPFGIYAVQLKVEGEGEWRAGAASFGIRPMFEVRQPLLETHIFDFAQEIYGKILRVRPIKYLRPEMHFGHIAELESQIREDCAAARLALDAMSRTARARKSN